MTRSAQLNECVLFVQLNNLSTAHVRSDQGGVGGVG